MGSSSYFKDLRLLALHAVLTEPHDYHFRQIHRWYAKTFFVPLPEVALLDQEHVLQAYYETQFEDQDPDQLEAERLDLLKTEEDRLRESMLESEGNAADAEFEAQADALAEKQRLADEKKPQIAQSAPPKDKETSLETMPVPKPGSKLPNNISLKFVSDEEFEKTLEAASFEETDASNLKVKPPDDFPKK